MESASQSWSGSMIVRTGSPWSPGPLTILRRKRFPRSVQDHVEEHFVVVTLASTDGGAGHVENIPEAAWTSSCL